MVLLSLGVPPDLSAQDVRAFISATDAAAREFQAYLAGGDTVASPTFFADLMAIGEASQPTLRSGGKPGDALAVTGSLGAPAAAIALLTAGQAGNCPCWPVLRERLVSPRPRVEEALALADLGLHAAIDISDGLMLDAGRMADASGCSAILEAAKLPVAEGVEGAASVLGRDPVEFVASGGEEYELLLAVPPAVLSDAERILASLGCRLTTVGGLREGGGTVLVDAVGKTIELPAAGWEHYGTGS
jgi:thiamine-monophosphate kinase